jgi:hypothetical protein
LTSPALATLKPSAVEASVMRAADVAPGALVRGVVARVLAEEAGAEAAARADELAAGRGTVALVRLAVPFAAVAGATGHPLATDGESLTGHV